MTYIQILTLVQSLIYSALILIPILYMIKVVLKKYIPVEMHVDNLPDNVVRGLALTIFLLMIGSIMLVTTQWFAALGPIEIILIYIFIPLYKKME